MPLALTLVTPPAGDVVTPEELRAHLRVSTNDDDEYVVALAQAATEAASAYLGRQLMAATYDLFLDSFPVDASFLYYQRLGCSIIELPRPPLISVTSVTYTDELGAPQTMPSTDYVVDTSTDPGRIMLAYGKVWPGTREIEKAVTIRFVAGYATRAAVPVAIRQAILLHTGTLYENRESTISGTTIAEVPNAYDALLWCHRTAESIL